MRREFANLDSRDDTGSTNRAPTAPSGLAVGRVLLPADERARI